MVSVSGEWIRGLRAVRNAARDAAGVGNEAGKETLMGGSEATPLCVCKKDLVRSKRDLLILASVHTCPVQLAPRTHACERR